MPCIADSVGDSLSPHIAAASIHTIDRKAAMVATQVRRLVDGAAPFKSIALKGQHKLMQESL